MPARLRRPSLAARLESWLTSHWWRPERTGVSRALAPLALLYRVALRWHSARHSTPAATPVPVVVVGNWVVGGAGKTPVVIALVNALQLHGWRPGVVSRGFGRRSDAVLAVGTDSNPAEVGDEPLLICRRTGVPVWVGSDRPHAVQSLCAAHPEVNVVVSDDGLQHGGLARVAEVVVFDERGVGNGQLLPAGPLRAAVPARLASYQQVLYTNGSASTTLPGHLARRSLGTALPLTAWWAGDGTPGVAPSALPGTRWLAVAGLASPEKFFGMLREAGLAISPCPQPDHAAYDQLPWPAGTKHVITTEKDAVKLPAGAVGDTQVWVVRLDLKLPDGLITQILTRLK